MTSSGNTVKKHYEAKLLIGELEKNQKLIEENNAVLKEISVKNERLMQLNSKLTQEVNQYRLAEHRRVQTQQCVDFAIRSLPWWKRSMKAVKLITNQYFAFIERTTEDIVAGDIVKQNQYL